MLRSEPPPCDRNLVTPVLGDNVLGFDYDAIASSLQARMDFGTGAALALIAAPPTELVRTTNASTCLGGGGLIVRSLASSVAAWLPRPP